MVARCSHQAVTKHATLITFLSHFLREDTSLASQEQGGWRSSAQKAELVTLRLVTPYVAFPYQTAIFDKRMPCITAQTIDRQLVCVGLVIHTAILTFLGAGPDCKNLFVAFQIDAHGR